MKQFLSPLLFIKHIGTSPASIMAGPPEHVLEKEKTMTHMFNSAVHEYAIALPHVRDQDIDRLLDDLARGRLSVWQEEYQTLKSRVMP